MFPGFHLFVILYEEPHLAEVIGDEYKKYMNEVPRWGIMFKGYDEQD